MIPLIADFTNTGRPHVRTLRVSVAVGYGRNPVVRSPVVNLIPWPRQLFVLAQLTVSSAAAAQRRLTVLTGKRGGEGLASQF